MSAKTLDAEGASVRENAGKNTKTAASELPRASRASELPRRFGNYTEITRELHGNYTGITRELHGNYTGTARELHGNYTGITREFIPRPPGPRDALEREREGERT